jgi:Methyltransferase domain
MFAWLRRKNVSNAASEDPGAAQVDGIGHRDYVGGRWDVIGAVQFRFMVDRGLEPHQVLLDIGCGSLRGGARFIPYLDRANYLGLDPKRELIDAGIKHELGEKLCDLKQPEFVTSEAFEFWRFSKQPDFALAQAVFSHLAEGQIVLCLKNLRAQSKLSTKFYATYIEAAQSRKIIFDYHPYIAFNHTRAQMVDFGAQANWNCHYIGNWGHPRGGVMVEYSAA